MRLSLIALPLAMAAATSFAQTGNMDNSAYDKLVRENATKFHRNFSAGDFDANGPLVTEDIDVDSNNVKFVGRQNFVNRIKRYSIPFPGLQLRDRIVVVDGNVAGVLYVLQGKHEGPYGTIPATGHKIEAMSGEVFEFNERALMKKLTTVTKLDDVAAEVKGSIVVADFQNVTILPNQKTSPDSTKKIRAAAAAFDANTNAKQFSRNDALLASDVQIETGEHQTSQGKQAFRQLSAQYAGAFPDMMIRDEYVLVDGNRAVVEYVMEGTQAGPLSLPGKATIAPTGKTVRVRGVRFMTFNEKGLLQDLVQVVNLDDFAAQLTAAQ